MLNLNTKKRLVQHIMSKHEGVKDSCDSCDYKATQLTHLKTIMPFFIPFSLPSHLFPVLIGLFISYSAQLFGCN